MLMLEFVVVTMLFMCACDNVTQPESEPVDIKSIRYHGIRENAKKKKNKPK